MHRYFLLSLLLLFSLTPSHVSAPPPSSPNAPTKCFEVTHPLPTDHQKPSYSVNLLDYYFKDTIGDPPVTLDYTPPTTCSCTWTAIVVEFTASCNGKQLSRIAAVWIDGVEILRTSTPLPAENGVFWKVRKDVTRYASVLQRANSSVSVMLENEVNDVFTGVYHVNVSLYFYEAWGTSVSSLESSVVKGEEGNRFKMSRKLGFLAEDDKEGERKMVSSGEESRELGFSSKLGYLGETSVNWDDDSDDDDDEEEDDDDDDDEDDDDDDLGRRLGFYREESEDREGSEKMIIKKFRGKKKDKERVGFLSEVTASLMDREEKQKSGFSHEEHPMLKTLRLSSEDLGMMDRKVKSNPLYRRPADLIIPIADYGDEGYWYRIQNASDIQSTGVQIPVNTYRAVLEIYVSSHFNDEFWYANPPNSFILQNNLITEQGNGAFRQVYATVDGLDVGSAVPFPVVYAGGINPLFWKPAVAIGAFDLPSYDLDLTPFLGNLLDGKIHSFSLGVTDALPFWLVDANLHLWLDPYLPEVKAKLVEYRAPELSISRQSEFKASGGEFEIKAEREIHFAGWVNSSFGNRTTYIVSELKFKNEIEIKRNGNFKEVEQKIKAKTEIRVKAYSDLLLAKAVFRNEYPLKIKTKIKSKKHNTDLSRTKFSHEMNEKSSVTLPSRKFSSSLGNIQKSNDRMLVQNHSVLSGVGGTQQKYKYKDGKGCYIRTVASEQGELLEDTFSNVCLEAM